MTELKDKSDEKKRAAAVSAVLSYLMMEAACAQPPVEPPAPTPPNAWGQSGRQNTMHIRQMMQLRVMRGSRAI